MLFAYNLKRSKNYNPGQNSIDLTYFIWLQVVNYRIGTIL